MRLSNSASMFFFFNLFCWQAFAMTGSEYSEALLNTYGINPELPNVVCIDDLGYTIETFQEHPIVKLSWAAKAQLKVLEKAQGKDFRISGIEALKFVNDKIGLEQAKKLAEKANSIENAVFEKHLKEVNYSQNKRLADDQANREKKIKIAEREAYFDGLKKFMSPTTMLAIGATVTTSAATIIGGYFASKHGMKKLFKPMPSIVSKSTIGKGKIPKPTTSRIHQLVYTDDLYQQLIETIAHTKKRVQMKLNGAEGAGELLFHDLLLSGPPGTGKTLFTETLAIEAGFDFIFVDGPRWSQLSTKESLKSLYQLMDIAKKHKQPVMIFIDEADAVFPKRKVDSQAENVVQDNKITNAWLAANPDGNDPNVMIVYATNLKESIDPAIQNRSKLITFTAPDMRVAAKTFTQYLLSKAKTMHVTVEGNLTDESVLLSIGQALEGQTQRQIMKRAVEIVEKAYLSGAKHILLNDIYQGIK